MVREFIQMLGGPQVVIDKLRAIGLEVKPDRVWQWGSRDRIPAELKDEMRHLARQANIDEKHWPEELQLRFRQAQKTLAQVAL